jgi:hypothetical protein
MGSRHSTHSSSTTSPADTETTTGPTTHSPRTGHIQNVSPWAIIANTEGSTTLPRSRPQNSALTSFTSPVPHRQSHPHQQQWHHTNGNGGGGNLWQLQPQPPMVTCMSNGDIIFNAMVLMYN